MTLHQTTIIAKKTVIWTGVSLGGIIVAVMLFQLGVIIKNIIFPPKIQPPTHAYNVLPAVQFPPNARSQAFTYTLNTVSGGFPDLPDRLNVFPIVQPSPNFLNINKARSMATQLGFLDNKGSLLPENALSNENYEWDEPTGIKRKLTINIVNFNLKLDSDYLFSLDVLDAKTLPNQSKAVDSVSNFLDILTLKPDDLDLSKTNDSSGSNSYTTYPQLFSIRNGQLVPTTSLSKTQVIRVDFYQKDIEYDLNTGIPELNGNFKKTHLKLPILYPNPPYSTMSFWVASGQFDTQIVAADFSHQKVSIPTDIDPTYSIKTAAQAYNELKDGGGYIAAYSGTDDNIKINNIYTAYYLGRMQQQYLMPIIVLEGDDGFIAYVSAVSPDWIK